MVQTPPTTKHLHQLDVGPDGTLRIGTRTVTGMLGKGGAAIVYEAWIPKLELTRAVKVMRPDQPERIKRRFETEMRISARLRHPNIVEIHTVGEWHELPFIEMEKIDGLDLDKILKRHHDVPEMVVTAVAVMVCRALAYAHNQEYTLYGVKHHGVVHRDLKPSNIMLANSGAVKLMDFGIAVPYTENSTLRTGVVDGTLQYIAPEQLRGEQVDPRADLFSLGAIMYEMISGVKAFRAANLKELVPLRMHNRYEPLRTVAPNATSRLLDIVEKCMAFDRMERWPDAQTLLGELEGLHARLTDRSPEEVVVEVIKSEDPVESARLLRRRAPHVRLAVAAALVLLAALAGIVLFLRSGSDMRKAGPEPVPAAQGRAIAEGKPQATAEPMPVENRRTEVQKPPRRPQISSAGRSKAPVAARKPAKAPVSARKPARSGASAGSPAPDPDKTSEGARPEPQETENQAAVAAPSTGPEETLKLLRELESQQNWAGLGTELARRELNDGEYLLRKGRYLKANGRYKDAVATFEKAMGTPAQSMNSRELAGHCLFSKAQCLSALFEQTPSARSGEMAMETWFMVKYQFRATPGNTYFVAADREIRRISERLRSAGNEVSE